MTLSPVTHEAMGAFLFDLGCDGWAVQPGDESTLKAYLPLPTELKATKKNILGFIQELRKIFPEIQTGPVTVTRLRAQDWSRSWRRFFRPQRVTPRLLTVPAWKSPPQHAGGEIILIDPGPAFGTGQHATTRMCLFAMEQAAVTGPWSMLDVGTGSGILAIYAALLGAGPILALDNDPEALAWAERNIALNGLDRRIKLSDMPLADVWERFSLITANLTLATIQDLARHFPRLLKPEGWLILSGLLREQVKVVRQVIRTEGLSMKKVLHRKEWATLVATKPSAEENS